jgi:hypothetical protein
MRSLGVNLLDLAVALVLVASATAQAGDVSTSLVPLGSFSSLRQDSEHCNGYSVELWRFGTSVRGLLHMCAGLTGDIRTGTISTGSYDQRSGMVSFAANLSLGMDYVKDGGETPSKDHFSFVGKLTDDSLVGKLEKTDEVYPNRKPRMISVRLKRQPEKLPSYSTYEDWAREVEKAATERAAK